MGCGVHAVAATVLGDGEMLVTRRVYPVMLRGWIGACVTCLVSAGRGWLGPLSPYLPRPARGRRLVVACMVRPEVRSEGLAVVQLR